MLWQKERWWFESVNELRPALKGRDAISLYVGSKAIKAYIYHKVMGANNVHRSPSFCFCAIIVGTLLPVINLNNSILPFVLSFACAIVFHHIILKTVPTSMSPVEGVRTRGMTKQA